MVASPRGSQFFQSPMSRDTERPSVSVLLPTYNRARFLDDAIASIQAQTWRDWELIVVDDGSTDDTPAVVERWRARIPQLRYIHRENGGAYAARNTGLRNARGEYIAFFDSDDLWLDHHLERCVTGLQQNPELDWIYAACRCIDPSGNVVQPTTFRVGEEDRPFLSLATRGNGDVWMISDKRALERYFSHGFYCGLQNSVIRRRVFEGFEFWEDYRVVEDVLFVARALARGIRFGYLTDIHVIYRIHDGNSSGSVAGASSATLLPIYQEYVRGLERVDHEVTLNKRERHTLRRSLARHYFWHLGYVCSWQAGDRKGALSAYWTALKLDPFDVWKWKTYLAAAVKTALAPQPASHVKAGS